ncbi:MAG: hypothetical protein K2N36_00580 [Ruminiclostridium sp.]|nr:hypothetical protein [Ruminiclostridium sp.]
MANCLPFNAVKVDGKYDRVELCYIEGNDAARKLYEKLGFSLTGNCEDDEIVMAKMLG